MLRDAVLSAVAQLRAIFPLEQRIRAAPPAVQQAYATVLRHWCQGRIPEPSLIAPEQLNTLTGLDAVVPADHGLGCYPFSARETGIRARLPGGTVPAMCAIDALAMARLAAAPVSISANCAVCETPLACRVEANGGLEHDQADAARVIWKPAGNNQGSCSEHLCRNLLFLCPTCTPPAGSTCYTLPQATAIGNTFFGFQPGLLRSLPAGPA